MSSIYEKFKLLFFCLIPILSIIIIKGKSIGLSSNNKSLIIKDVLFINCYNIKTNLQSYRYRVLNQIEQLNAGFLETDIINYLEFEPAIVKNYRVIIFACCPLSEKVDKAITLTKILNKKVLLDIDDLFLYIKFTSENLIIKNIAQKEIKKCDDIIKRVGKSLKIFDGVITTTKTLAEKLKHYNSNIFFNHNVANEEMWKLSENALKKNRNNKIYNNLIIIGYISMNNDNKQDIEMIKPVLLNILREYSNTRLLILGDNITQLYLNEFSEKIIYKKISDRKKLPEIISTMDINIVPLENTCLNEVKNGNKWLEAALVKVPTISTNFGVYKQLIIHNETGLLCTDLEDWYISIKTLINNIELRKILGENAYNNCKKEYDAINSGNKLVNYINSITNKHIGFFMPTLENYGGIYVILKHAFILKNIGWDVDLILPEVHKEFIIFQGIQFNVISLKNATLNTQYDIIVATYFSTLYLTLNYFKTKKHLYLIQNYETNFFPYGNSNRNFAEKTYSANFGVEYITISKWCQNWLWKKYRKKSKYAPNGIDIDNYKYYKRNLNKSIIRILIEGDSSSHYKNVDESFKIAEKLDKNKFEIWFLSNSGFPKKWYHFDKFFHNVEHEKVQEIYYNSDILLKSSWLESFSYPPLEMMATGGYCILVPNEGNKEYLKHEENCLFYKLGDINSGVENINRIIKDYKLQNSLYKNGIITAKNRDWKKLKSKIIQLYDF